MTESAVWFAAPRTAELRPAGVRPLLTTEGQLPFPVKFSYQEVGEVEAVGARTDFEIGERVSCFHPHQTRFTLDTSLVWRIPAGVDPHRAAFRPAVVTSSGRNPHPGRTSGQPLPYRA
ncbi:hypothetical protein [Rhodococcus jostii]|uniref:Hedgehog/Intein (Hint) domain-containing protein n=1 Tax=Rhodococcus jostii TaxID=132919 RepID=A0ABU4C971_RHOJO|nr:hypothetical protein [Rhodococcus jostii]MDV6280095.1 hypothetical protein [Rhodococcus jostii]